MIEPNIHKMKTDRAWDRLYGRLAEDNLLAEPERRTRRIMSLSRYGIAAAAVIACLIYGVTFFLSSGYENQLQDMLTQENPDASSLVTTLEDGSIVFLATQASLKYPVHFDLDGRNVTLQGDAYFDIAQMRERPFVIETENARIKVLGTAFNVRSDREDVFNLSVQRGCVSVTLKKNGEAVYVKAGETVTLQGDQLNVGRQSDTDPFERYWKNFRFKDESLGNILRVINLNSPDLKIQASSALEKRKLTVAFTDYSPEMAAELICLALNIKCVRQGNILVLSE